MVVVNARQVRDFARATGKLAKTAALDAAVLAHFAEVVRPPVRPLRDAETQALNSLAARRHQVMTMLVSEKNRLSAAATVAIRPRIKAHIAWLERELDDLDKGLRQTLRQSPVWREKDGLLYRIVSQRGKIFEDPNYPSFKSAIPAFGDRLSHQETIAVLTYIKSFWGDKTKLGLSIQKSQSLVSAEDTSPGEGE